MFIYQVAQKIVMAEGELKKLNLKERPKVAHVNKEQISDEEMYTLRKIGLHMKPFVLIGKILFSLFSNSVPFIIIEGLKVNFWKLKK